MITGLKVDTTPRVAQSGGSSGSKASGTRKGDSADFADQLLGSKSERLENPDRKERNLPGRETSNRSREGNRSSEREPDSKADSDLRVSKNELRKKAAKREERAESRSPSSQSVAPSIQNKSQPTEPPIVVEPPQGEDSQELRLPDFFSSTETKKGSAVAGESKPATTATAIAAAKAAAAMSETPAAGAGAVGAPATSETAGLLAAMKDGEGVSRKDAMKAFVTKMQEELGIPPEKLLSALAQMDTAAIEASPDDAAKNFLSGLELGKEQTAKASALYQDLLKTTGASLLTEKVAGLDSDVNFEVLSARDAGLKKIDSSLDELNTSFFRKGASDLKKNPEKAQAALESMDAALAKLMANAQKESAPAQTTPDSQAALAAALAPSSSAAANPVAAETLAGVMSAQTNPLAAALQAGANEGDFEKDLSDLLETKGVAKGAVASTALLAGNKEVESSFADEMKTEMAKEDSDVSDLRGDGTAKTGAFTDSETPAPGSFANAMAQPAAKSSVLTGPADMIMNRQPTSDDEQANVRDLIKNAQLMVKRGGGEMKLEMTPEGMGKVQLKVAVENGQVNVQMLTESDSAKRLIEKGMSELRTTLAAQDLKVATMTVDVGDGISKQMDQQGTQDHARQQARNFAQDFMGSFRDERQGFQQGLFETNNGWRSYGRNQRREELGPEVSSSVSAASRSNSSSDAKRLNLVA